MRILAIGGSGPAAVAAGRLQDGRLVVAASAERAGNADADRLPEQVQACLAEAGWTAAGLDLIACGVGPGGFTSIRVAVALARGLALAAQLPVLAVTSFEALAASTLAAGLPRPWRLVVPGGRGNWHVQDSRSDGQLVPVRTEAMPPAPEPGVTMIGDGVPGGTVLAQDALAILAAAARKVQAGERGGGGEELVPLYLRGADAREGAGRSLLDLAGSA